MSDLVTTEAMERLRGVVTRHPYPLVFATISGRTSTASRRPTRTTTCGAVTCCQCAEVVGLDAGRETIETSGEGW